MPRLMTLTFAAIGTLAIAGCATMNVSSHVERGLDVSRYHTYDWGPADALPAGDARLEQNPFFQDHLRGEVEKAMARRGFEWSTGDAPDLLLHYHANITERIDIDRLDAQRGYCGENGCDVPTVQYEAGTLVIDVIDARTNRLIWRGWAQSAVRGMLANQDTAQHSRNQTCRAVSQGRCHVGDTNAPRVLSHKNEFPRVSVTMARQINEAVARMFAEFPAPL